jgi:hypothetical protein
MSYTYQTLGGMKTSLSQLLGDTSMRRWVDAELGMLIGDALKMLNSMAGVFRGRGSIATSSGLAFYDLPTTLYGLVDRHFCALVQ